ncbi:porin [Collimonas sp.]|uniref:porin n=1 Tax=Collimonas sp. TaxID=1963772 RepID=UPI002C749489|nr:porin [Collimonas sp.]HWW07218.1 porin [Collimonas sp.]
MKTHTKMLSLSVLGTTMAMASNVTMAQSNVTMYGQVTLGLVKESNRALTLRETGFNSFIGIRGSEQLGGGLQALFDLRSNFFASDGRLNGPVLFNNNAYVGLSGALGTVKIGRNNNAFNDVHNIGNPFRNTVANRSIFGPDDFHENAKANLIGYYSPTVNGFAAAATVALKDKDTTPELVRDAKAINITYTSGPLLAALGYEAASTRKKSTIIGGNYNFGPVTLFASYARQNNIAAGNGRAKNYDIGLALPIANTPGTVRAMYAQSTGSAAIKSHHAGLGYWYTLSKRTFLYADFGHLTFRSSKANVNKVDLGLTHSF